jgi:multidrug resistance efflux pump
MLANCWGNQVPAPMLHDEPLAPPSLTPAVVREPSAPRRRSVRESLYRPQALEDYLRRDLHGALQEATASWGAKLFGASVTLVLTLVLLLVFAKVEVTSRGSAVLRTEKGAPRPIVVQVGGVVIEVLRHTGDMVRAGETILHTDSTLIRREKVDADRKVDLAQAALARAEGTQRRVVESRVQAYDQQASLLLQRVASEETSIQRLQEQLAKYEVLLAHGNVALYQRDEIAERMAQEQRTQLTLKEQVQAIQSQRASLLADYETELWRAKQDVTTAESKLQSLQVGLEQTTIRASQDGYIEALLVHTGDVLQAGTVVAQLVSSSPPGDVIAFLPERDRAYLEVGAEARVELAQLPRTENPPLHAKVRRISRNLATANEFRDALGDEAKTTEPAYRVELELVSDPTEAKVRPLLRSGMLGSTRFVLRKRRLLNVVFAPLQQWVDS